MMINRKNFSGAPNPNFSYYPSKTKAAGIQNARTRCQQVIFDVFLARGNLYHLERTIRANTKSIVFRSLQRNQRSIPITNTPDRLSILKRDFFSNRGLLTNYSSKKDRVDITTTSRLSPFITNGVLSQSDLFKAAKISVEKNPTMAESAKEYERQIAWRDYFSTILYKTPEIELRTLDASLFGIPWVNHEDDYSRWVNGETGYPIVDSAMRQLATEGWIHNRLRMIVASFLVKHCLLYTSPSPRDRSLSRMPSSA